MILPGWCWWSSGSPAQYWGWVFVGGGPSLFTWVSFESVIFNSLCEKERIVLLLLLEGLLSALE